MSDSNVNPRRARVFPYHYSSRKGPAVDDGDREATSRASRRRELVPPPSDDAQRNTWASFGSFTFRGHDDVTWGKAPSLQTTSSSQNPSTHASSTSSARPVSHYSTDRSSLSIGVSREASKTSSSKNTRATADAVFQGGLDCPVRAGSASCSSCGWTPRDRGKDFDSNHRVREHVGKHGIPCEHCGRFFTNWKKFATHRTVRQASGRCDEEGSEKGHRRYPLRQDQADIERFFQRPPPNLTEHEIWMHGYQCLHPNWQNEGPLPSPLYLENMRREAGRERINSEDTVLYNPPTVGFHSTDLDHADTATIEYADHSSADITSALLDDNAMDLDGSMHFDFEAASLDPSIPTVPEGTQESSSAPEPIEASHSVSMSRADSTVSDAEGHYFASGPPAAPFRSNEAMGNDLVSPVLAVEVTNLQERVFHDVGDPRSEPGDGPTETHYPRPSGCSTIPKGIYDDTVRLNEDLWTRNKSLHDELHRVNTLLREFQMKCSILHRKFLETDGDPEQHGRFRADFHNFVNSFAAAGINSAPSGEMVRI